MVQDSLAGSRIRERRIMAGIRQAELAKAVGISASYLNLIEHNKRRIGGKLLLDLAQVLQVEPSALSEGAEATLIAKLREAASDATTATPELDRIDEFAGRFPGWAQLIAEGHQQLRHLERTVESLTDRLAHDPHLATSMHEVLSMAAAIRSTAGILFENKELEPEWRGRFHRNLNEDSQRLADSAEAVVSYLDGEDDAAAELTSPQDELDAFLQAAEYHFPSLEQPGSDISAVLARTEVLSSRAAHEMAKSYLATYQSDALLMPIEVFAPAIAELGMDPAALAQQFNVGLAAVMRRLVALPKEVGLQNIGLVVCDGAGTLVFRKEPEGFPLPRFSAACPKWPLFQALTRPMQPIQVQVEMAGRDALQFDCMAIAEPQTAQSFKDNALYHGYMLIRPDASRVANARPVGPTCRICPRLACQGRREPSILATGL
ncbi:MAG: short-chain fatty acyl-CoA regulator family protein [Cognatishimia sp.]